jgi:radical SAM superfamily enzyme YgiQ (UPF0313 family)
MNKADANTSLKTVQPIQRPPSSLSHGSNVGESYQYFLDKLPPLKTLILINPMLVPKAVFEPMIARKKGYYIFPPLGLLYLAAIARDVDPSIKLHVVDLNFEMLMNAQEEGFDYDFWEGRLAELIENCESPYIGITYMFESNKDTFTEIANFIRTKFPSVPLIGGGVQATYDYEELIEVLGLDGVIRREGENQFKIFLQNVLKKDKASIPEGMAFSHEGKVGELDPSSEEVSVGTNITPVYPLIPIEDYYRYGSLAAFSRFNGDEKPFATLLGIRGCRAFCTFCTVRDFNGKGLRDRDVESIIDELRFLHYEKGIMQIDWLDDDLLWNRDRALLLFKRMTEELPKLEWICNNGLIAAVIDEELMEWMVRSGMKAFKVGIESGNNAMLKRIKKPTSKRKLMAVSPIFKKYPEVLCSGNYIIGFPNETFQEMLDTYELSRALNWDWASFYLCQPLKGTEMFSVFENLDDERIKKENYDKLTNPGRSAVRGEFGMNFDESKDFLARGREIFDLPRDLVPNLAQQNEIWFAFNFIVNFIENPNFQPGGNVKKIVDWFESIASGYPYDASMQAALAHGYHLMGNEDRSRLHQEQFKQILDTSNYWQRRAREFPEMLDMAKL